jgi:D-sedoheptulose 7-phosphate isomerase
LTDASRSGFVRDVLLESAAVKQAMAAEPERILRVADRLASTFRAGGRLYACGNGGSACDAMHLVEELVARYKRERPGLPAHHLIDGPTLTCWSNDYDYLSAFQRQVETMLRPGDVLVAISTSGQSRNVILAAEAAVKRGGWTLALVGGSGGALAERADEVLAVPSTVTARVQEAHITIIHLLCELIEDALFPVGGEPFTPAGAGS